MMRSRGRWARSVLLAGIVGIATACAREAGPPRTAEAGAVWPSERIERVNLSEMFVGIDGEATFVLLEGESGRVRVHDPERARRRFPPASTFKIPNSLIALETGVADGPEFPLPFDSVATPARSWWPRSWAGDQTMRTAFRESVAWYYQELARRIGPERMAEWVERLDYGNLDTSPEVDRFWLEGSLRISPEEQVEFLRRLWAGELPVSGRTAAVVRELLRLEEGDGWRLSGKTGTAELTPTRELGWLVGAVERTAGEAESGTESGAAWFFALEMEGERVWEEWPPSRRTQLVKRILRRLASIPPDPPPGASRGTESLAPEPRGVVAPPFVAATEDAPVAFEPPTADPDRWLLAFLDVETTGLVPGWHEMIDLGLVMTDLEGVPVDSLFLRIQPEHPERTSEGARRVNAFDPARWRELGALSTEASADSLARFHRRVAGDRPVMLVAFNSWFDAAFLDYLFRGKGGSWRELYHYFVLDIPSMAWSVGYRGLNGTELSRALGIPDEPHVAEQHTGLTGARLNARLYRALRERRPQETRRRRHLRSDRSVSGAGCPARGADR
ncbi:MAG: penicillin-binding transpeptidase domain-containing protein [Gemmatimonadota bacterium]